jgi:hypothetical protein
MSMPPPGQPPFQQPGGPYQVPSGQGAPYQQPSQPPYRQGPYPSQPYAPQGQWPGAMPPPQMPPPPTRSRSKLIWILGGVALVLLVCCIGGVVVFNSGKNSSNATASNSTNPPTTSQGPHKVGDVVKTQSWEVTINKVSAYAGDPNQLDVPGAGNTFLLVEGTFKNLSQDAQTLSIPLMFELQDSKGTKYDQSPLSSVTGPDGTVLPNGPATGKWGYEVPTSVHNFILIFSEDFGQTNTTWNVSI